MSFIIHRSSVDSLSVSAGYMAHLSRPPDPALQPRHSYQLSQTIVFHGAFDVSPAAQWTSNRVKEGGWLSPLFPFYQRVPIESPISAAILPSILESMALWRFFGTIALSRLFSKRFWMKRLFFQEKRKNFEIFHPIFFITRHCSPCVVVLFFRFVAVLWGGKFLPGDLIRTPTWWHTYTRVIYSLCHLFSEPQRERREIRMSHGMRASLTPNL